LGGGKGGAFLVSRLRKKSGRTSWWGTSSGQEEGKPSWITHLGEKAGGVRIQDCKGKGTKRGMSPKQGRHRTKKTRKGNLSSTKPNGGLSWESGTFIGRGGPPHFQGDKRQREYSLPTFVGEERESEHRHGGGMCLSTAARSGLQLRQRSQNRGGGGKKGPPRQKEVIGR